MARLRERLPPSAFKNLIKRVGGKPYLPKKITDALRRSKASKFFWSSATKRQTQRALEGLRSERLMAPKFLNPRHTPKRLTAEAFAGPPGAATGGRPLPLGSGRLPGKIRTEKFFAYYRQLTHQPETAHTLVRQFKLIGQEFLSKRQQVMILSQLRELGKLTRPNIGADIQRAERRRQAFVKEGISAEQEELTKRYVAHEDLPAGVLRSIGRPPADRAATTVHGRPERAVSISRLEAVKRLAADTPEEHATTGSEFARQAGPRGAKTSAARTSKIAARPDRPVPDLPVD